MTYHDEFLFTLFFDIMLCSLRSTNNIVKDTQLDRMRRRPLSMLNAIFTHAKN